MKGNALALLVSAIMPTRGRPEMALLAVESFRRQDYTEKELLILDDTDNASFPFGWPEPIGVCHYRLQDRASIGAKRNALCELARGDIIVHWDSDDFSRFDRISHQVRLMEESGKAVIGYHSLLFYGPQPGRVTKYIGDRFYALGSSLCYRKSFWQENRFRDDSIGEDNHFVFGALNAYQLHAVDGESYLVARIHDGNTSKKDSSGYRNMRVEDLPAGFPG